MNQVNILKFHFVNAPLYIFISVTSLGDKLNVTIVITLCTPVEIKRFLDKLERTCKNFTFCPFRLIFNQLRLNLQ